MGQIDRTSIGAATSGTPRGHEAGRSSMGSASITSCTSRLTMFERDLDVNPSGKASGGAMAPLEWQRIGGTTTGVSEWVQSIR